MISKFNKNVICCLALALFGGGSLHAEELMSNHVKFALGGNTRFFGADETFKATTGKEVEGKGFKWGAGGELEYVYNFCPLFGVGVNARFVYNSLDRFEAPESGTTSGSSDANKTDANKESFLLNGFAIEPALVFNFNFLEDGVLYDESSESAAGLGLSAKVLVGASFNFNMTKKEDFKKLAEKITGIDDSKKDNYMAFSFCTPKAGVSFDCTLPFGLYFGLGLDLYGLGLFPITKGFDKEDKELELKPASNGNNSDDAKKSDAKFDKFNMGFELHVGYDFANLFM